MNTSHTVLVIVFLVVSSTAPVGVATATQQGEAYAGTHIEFETASNAIVDYSVSGDTILQSVKVQSQSNAQSQGDVRVGVGLTAVTDITGAALSLDSQTEVSATVTAESGAAMQAHDNARGILVVRSGDSSQYVTVNVSRSSQAESESAQRVVVTTEDGTKGTFIVVGDGEVTVNEQGNVSANLGSDGTLVFRSYPEGRDDDDQRQEQLIAEGKAAAEVYVMQKSNQASGLAADVVQYSEDTTVEVTEKSTGMITMTAERSQEQGTIILTSLSEQAIRSVENFQVTVDGEAAAQASSYSELESAANDGDSSKYLVRQQSGVEASADVLVAVNHFSTRELTMSDGSGTSDGSNGSDTESSSDDTESQETTSTDASGFGPVVAMIALLSTAAVAVFRRG